MATLSLNGLDLYYEQQGEGSPVVFVHGGVLNGEMTWSAQQPLAGRWNLIIIDRPGFGSSPPVDRVDSAADAAMLITERGPWEADIPLRQLARAPFPKLVVSGAHSAAFDAVCDVLERDLGADRAVIPGAGHSIPRTGEAFNQQLERFLTDAEGGQ